MHLRLILYISLFAAPCFMQAQKVAAIYKTADLLKRIDTTSGPLVVNFWATWCKPCVEELPAFDSLRTMNKNAKVLLVCLDFAEEREKKVDPFLQKKKINSECVILDEVNGNDYIDKISAQWSGAIPATLLVYGKQKKLIEKKMRLSALQKELELLLSGNTE